MPFTLACAVNAGGGGKTFAVDMPKAYQTPRGAGPWTPLKRHDRPPRDLPALHPLQHRRSVLQTMRLHVGPQSAAPRQLENALEVRLSTQIASPDLNALQHRI